MIVSRAARRATPVPSPSERMMRLMPLGSVVVASAIPMMLPVILNVATVPSPGLVLYLAWRLLRPHLWSVWAGLPLGLWDDLVSGNALGSGMALWALAALAIDYADYRLLWRGFAQNWAIAALVLALIVPITALLTQHAMPLAVLGQLTAIQVVAGIGLFPIATLWAARLDSWRLRRK